MVPLMLQAILLLASGSNEPMISISFDGGMNNYFIGQEINYKQYSGLIFLSLILFINVYLLMRKHKKT